LKRTLCLLLLGCAAGRPELSPQSTVADSGLPDCADLGQRQCDARFSGSASALTAEQRQKMIGVTWREGCPVSLDDLAWVELRHWDYEGRPRMGQLVVAARRSEELLAVFAKLYAARFPFQQFEPIEAYGGNDDLSMAANNSSAFNCRAVTGGVNYSRHAYGEALDLNPLQNPYVKGTLVLPPEGSEFTLRDPTVLGLITSNGPVVAAFKEAGWTWGGDFTSLKDYQHFEHKP
jgi:hypothetical protein